MIGSPRPLDVRREIGVAAGAAALGEAGAAGSRASAVEAGPSAAGSAAVRPDARPALAPGLLPLRDAAAAALALAVVIYLGSGGLAYLDPALVGYLAATFLAAVLSAYRVSAFWRRPASALYARELRVALRRPRSFFATLGHAGRDLAAQSFVRRRSVVRWLAHLLLSLGTLASFAITVPLVFGWMHFRAEGDEYRLLLFGVPSLHFATDGGFAWMMFHALSLAGVAVALGATVFLVMRFRARRLPGAASGFALGPLVLLLWVALTGLALPASRGMPALFPIAAVLHELSVIVLLVAIPFSKLGHVLIRPLQLGARAMRAPAEPRLRCACGALLAPLRQHAGVGELLAGRGFRFGSHASLCPPCRRRCVAATQAQLVGASFQPRLPGARPARPRDAGEVA